MMASTTHVRNNVKGLAKILLGIGGAVTTLAILQGCETTTPTQQGYALGTAARLYGVELAGEGKIDRARKMDVLGSSMQDLARTREGRSRTNINVNLPVKVERSHTRTNSYIEPLISRGDVTMLRDSDEFYDFIFDGHSVVTFTAHWAKPSESASWTIDKASEDPAYDHIKFGRIECLANRPDDIKDLQKLYSAQNIPTTIFFYNGEEIHRENGAYPDRIRQLHRLREKLDETMLVSYDW